MTTGDKEPAQTDVKWLYPGAGGTLEQGGHSSSQGDTTDMDSDLQTDRSLNGSEQLGEKSSPTSSGCDTEAGSLDDLPRDHKGYIPEDLTKQVAAASSYVGSFFNPSAWKPEDQKEATEEDGKVKSGSSFFSFSKVPGLAKTSPTVDQKENGESEENGGSFFSSAFNKMGISNMASSLTMENLSGKVAAAAGATYPDTPPNGEEGAKEEENWSYTSLTSAISKASKVASDYSKVIQDSVNKAPLLADFNHEQQEFIKSKGEKEQPSAPWSGYQNEEELKEKVLALSEDRRNCLRAPPSGVNFDFEYSAVAAHAVVLLAEDPRLKQLRYELVPKKVKEDEFWRNYFYRVGLVKQSFELSNSMASDPVKKSVPLPNPLDEEDQLASSGDQEDEFVSELHQASSKDIKEADEAMRKLGLTKNDAEWEAELEGELNEYEMVGDDGEGDANSGDNPEWENQIQEMLDAESKK